MGGALSCALFSKTENHYIYSRTSMAWKSLGLQKFVQDTGSSSHWGLIMVPGQKTNDDNLGKSFQSSTQ